MIALMRSPTAGPGSPPASAVVDLPRGEEVDLEAARPDAGDVRPAPAVVRLEVGLPGPAVDLQGSGVFGVQVVGRAVLAKAALATRNPYRSLLVGGPRSTDPRLDFCRTRAPHRRQSRCNRIRHGTRASASTYGLARWGREPCTHFRPAPAWQGSGIVETEGDVTTATGLPQIRHIQNPVSVGFVVFRTSNLSPSKHQRRDRDAAQRQRG